MNPLQGLIHQTELQRAYCYVFYATLLYGEYPARLGWTQLNELPDGCYLYYPLDNHEKHWYLKDLTPVLIEDVPKELRALVLIMGI